jgi:L-fucose isomerase
MEMARAAKKLIEENCFYSDGTKAGVVIADTTIAGGREAAEAESKFAAENVTATLSVTPCWCYGSETMDLNPLTVKAVWGFNGTERPGAVYLAAVMAAHAQRGLPAFAIYGKDVQDAGDKSVPDDVKEKLIRFGRCALAVGQMRNKSYVSIGAVSMGIAGSDLNAKAMQDYFGIRAEWTDMVEILRRIELGIYDRDEYEKALRWVKSSCREGADLNETVWERGALSRGEKDAQWEFTVKTTLIIRDIMFGNDKLKAMGFHEEALGKNAVLGGFQGQRQWTDYKPNADFPEAVLASTFDWNGKKEPVIVVTENDNCNGMSMLFQKLLTGRASCFADVRTYWSPAAVKRVSGYSPEGKAKDGFIHLLNSGAAALDGTGAAKNASGGPEMKRWREVTDADIKAMLQSVEWAPANRGYFRGGGYSSSFSTKGEMPVTLTRLNYVHGIGYVLQLAEGWTADLPDGVNKTLLDRTDPTWPSTWFAPRLDGSDAAFADVYSVMANWGANHGAFTYGHIGADLITLAAMLRIPVAMHNVPESLIYRPHAWSAFGTKEPESADFRACKVYGPIYG